VCCVLSSVPGEVERCDKYPEEGGRVPALEELLELSNSSESYNWLCNKLLPFVVGFKRWMRQYYKVLLSDIATCSDETFLLLTLENNYARWTDEAIWIKQNKEKLAKDQEKKQFAPARYTNSGKSQANGRSRPFQGWARDGYIRFNELYQLVAADRRKRTVFEKERLVMCRNALAYEKDSSDSEEEQEEIYPANDLTGERVTMVLGSTKRLGDVVGSDDDDESNNYEDEPPTAV
jgi:hypothetical protein